MQTTVEMFEQNEAAPEEKLAVIKGSGKTGNFVLESQSLATAEGFGHVSKRWYDKTLSYDRGFEILAAQADNMEDVFATALEMTPTVDAEGRFSFLHRPSERYFRPTLFAINQVGDWADTGSWYVQHMLGEGPLNSKGEPRYNRDRLDAETLAQVVRNGFRRLDPRKQFLFRVNKQKGVLRAMLSTKYARVDNEWVLRTLQRFIPGGRLSHWDKSDEETIFGNILIPDTIRREEDSDYGGMLSVSNSQIGERIIGTLPSVFRAICMNGCIWDRTLGKAFRRVHRGVIELDDLALAIRKNLEMQIPLLPTCIDRLLGTRKFLWAGDSIKPLFAAVAGEFKFTRRQAGVVLEAFGKEPEKSLFGVVNSVTRAGQLFERPAEWVRADQVGGELVQYSAADWERLTSRAKTMKVKEVEDMFMAA